MSCPRSACSSGLSWGHPAAAPVLERSLYIETVSTGIVIGVTSVMLSSHVLQEEHLPTATDPRQRNKNIMKTHTRADWNLFSHPLLITSLLWPPLQRLFSQRLALDLTQHFTSAQPLSQHGCSATPCLVFISNSISQFGCCKQSLDLLLQAAAPAPTCNSFAQAFHRLPF